MQRRHIFDVILMRIKCIVKNVIVFDLIFDTNQKKSKSNFSCSVIGCFILCDMSFCVRHFARLSGVRLGRASVS